MNQSESKSGAKGVYETTSKYLHTDLSPSHQLMRMGLGVMTTQMLAAVAQLDIADKLADGPRSADDLARASGAQPDFLYRVLRTLTSLGVFEELPERKFALTEVSQLLRTGVPVSLRDMVVFFGSAWSSKGCSHLLDAMKSGKSGIEEAFGMNVFQYLGSHHDDLAVFQGAMTGFSSVQSPPVVDAYDFTPFRRIIDIAGGHGALLAHILNAAPQATGAVLELPEVVANGPELAKSHGLADRMEFIAGDMFEAVPAGGDCYVLKYIVHDWGDAAAKQFLSNIRKGIKPEGKLIVVDSVIPQGPHIGKIFDAYMVVLMPGGVERTQEEFAALFASAGFKLTRVIPTGSYLSIVEGVPI
ncbi:MAG TPA: methyltransferase [Kofleriaceae bacterium]|nr:methyltransferase [Kofleriaceae bacterium]